MAGLVVRRKNLTTKKGEMMSFVELEDLDGRFETIVFPKTLSTYRDMIREGEVLLISGRISAREDEEPKLLADKIAYLPDDEAYAREDYLAPFTRPKAIDQHMAVVAKEMVAKEDPDLYDEPGTNDLPFTAEDRLAIEDLEAQQALMAANMSLLIRCPLTRGSRKWKALLASLRFFPGDLPVLIRLDKEGGVLWGGGHSYKIVPNHTLLAYLAELCGQDAISFLSESD